MKRVGTADAKETKGLTPDEWDAKNIQNLIAIWQAVHPRGQVRYLQDSKNPKQLWVEYLNIDDHLEYMRKVVKQDRKLSAIHEKVKGDPIHLDTSLPPAFAAELRKSYPTLLNDRKQTLWFLRKFPQFKL